MLASGSSGFHCRSKSSSPGNKRQPLPAHTPFLLPRHPAVPRHCACKYGHLFLAAHSENGFRPFYSKRNNWFDASIVAVSIASVLMDVFEVGGSAGVIKMIRLVRVVRVTRFFSHFQQLNRIVQAIGGCFIPMINAFCILLVVTTIYAVLGTQLFRERSPEFFLDFTTALFTMIQVVMGDSWASAITRSFFEVNERGVKENDPAVALFFTSYVVIGSVTLLNVVVAVLLDEFIATVVREKEAAALRAEAENDKRRIKGVLDPITSKLCAFEDADNLVERIDDLYERLDSDGSGGLNFDELKEGIKRLPGIGRIHMTADDFGEGARKQPPSYLAPVCVHARSDAHHAGTKKKKKAVMTSSTSS